MKSFNESSPENPVARIDIGEGSYINFNCNFIDDGIITIGKSVMFGSAVTFQNLLLNREAYNGDSNI